MVITQVSLVPVGTGSASVSDYVVSALNVLDRHPEVKYRLTPMGTVIEAELDDLWPVIREMHEACFAAGAKRVILDLRIDDRRDKDLSMDGKISAVRRKKPDVRVE